MASTNSFLGVFLLTLFTNPLLEYVLSAQISISPESFIEAVTGSIYISCCPDGTSARAKEILLMEIAKDGEKPITNIRQNSQISYGDGITNRFQKYYKASNQAVFGPMSICLPTGAWSGGCSAYYDGYVD